MNVPRRGSPRLAFGWRSGRRRGPQYPLDPMLIFVRRLLQEIVERIAKAFPKLPARVVEAFDLMEYLDSPAPEQPGWELERPGILEHNPPVEGDQCCSP